MANIASEPRNGYANFAAQRTAWHDLMARAEKGELTVAEVAELYGDNVVPLHVPSNGRGGQPSANTLRHALRGVGYAPIPVNGKKPPLQGWQKLLDVAPEIIDGWDTNPASRYAHNTGLLTERTPGIDIDILDAAAADAVEQMVRERFKERGSILVRIGLPPKRLVPFRTAVAFKKIKVALIAADGSAQKIEFLGKGQQFVAFGVHPDTHKPYQWSEAGEPGKIKLNALPEISAAEALELVEDVAELLVKDFGYRRAGDDKEEQPSSFKKFADSGKTQHLDWSKPINNILAGVDLHDNIRDLAASMITSSVSAFAAKGLLKALMQSSSARHDERWKDRFDDIDRTVDGAFAKYAQPKAEPLRGLESYFLEELQERPVVLLQWIVEGFILAGKVNGLFGDGGVGKDLLLLQLAIAMTCGGTWLGHEVKQGRVMYFVVEDDDDELRRREDKITYYLKQVLGKYQPIPKQLKIIALVGEETVLAVFDHKTGKVQSTELFIQIYNMIEEFQPDVVIVGNRVDIFSVNQNDDAQAKQCMQLLTKICKHLQTTVIMPGHVSIGGKTTGTSGSVQWSNACRHRIYLRRVKDEKTGEEDDPNLRELEVMKTNHGMTGRIITMRWLDGIFKTDHVAVVSELEEKGADVVDENDVLRMLDGLIEGDSVSPSENSKSYFGKKFLKGRFRGRNGKTRLEEAIKRLHSRNVIKTIFVGPPSKLTPQLVRWEFDQNRK